MNYINTEKLINVIRQYPLLYDVSDSKYMDYTLKAQTWDNIGTEMNATSVECKARWYNIRDIYRKSLKNPKNDKRYKYAHLLNFIDKYLTGIKLKSKSPVDEHEHNSQSIIWCFEEQEAQFKQESQVEDANDELESKPSTQRLQRHTLRNKLKHSKQTALEIEDPLLFTSNIRKEWENPDQHIVDAFLTCLAPTLKSFNPYYLNLAKSEIFTVVQKYELKMLEQTMPISDATTECGNINC